MEKIGVTTASDFADLDGLACAIAYTELLRLEGKEAEAIIPGEINASVTDEIKGWDYEYKKSPSKDIKWFVLVDTTHNVVIPEFTRDNLIEIYDHHIWDRDFWRQRLGDKAVIEKVGAAATLIWEEFVKREKTDSISQTSARLIYAAIISNTLNFKANVTTQRDIKTFKDLKEKANLPENWAEKYFGDLEKGVWEDPRKTILNDTKKPQYYEGLGKKITIGQVELWNSKKFIIENTNLIAETLESLGTEFWFFNSPSISEGKSYIYTKSTYIKDFLTKYFDIEFQGDLGQCLYLIERKEFMEKILNL